MIRMRYASNDSAQASEPHSASRQSVGMLQLGLPRVRDAPVLDKSVGEGFRLSYSRSVVQTLKLAKDRLRKCYDGSYLLGFCASNEHFYAAMPTFKSAVSSSALDSIRFMGITGGGDQYLRLIGAISETGKRIESIAAVDKNVVQLLNLNLLAKRENEAARTGELLIVRELRGVLGRGSASNALLVRGSDNTTAYSLYDFSIYNCSNISNRFGRLEAVHHEELFDEALEGIVAKISTKERAVTVEIRTEDGGVAKQALLPDVSYGLVPRINVRGQVPVINAFNSDVFEYLKKVQRKDAPNVIYLSNWHEWEFDDVAKLHAYVLRTKKFEEGTMIVYARPNSYTLNYIVKDGGKLRYACLKGKPPVHNLYYDPQTTRSPLTEDLKRY